MNEVILLVFPLFSLFFLGFISGKLKKIPLSGLEWLNFFVVYITLPSLMYRLLARTPVEQFANFSFLATTTFVTLVVFSATFFIAALFNRGNVAESTIQGFAGAYGNIGYMGPPLAIAAFGPAAGVPVALIFCLDNAMHFTFAPILMSMDGAENTKFLTLVKQIISKVFGHPVIIATVLGIASAYFGVRLPDALDELLSLLAMAAAPCALFAMGITAALHPMKSAPFELGYLLPIKLIIHPLLMWFALTSLGEFEPVWVYSAVLLAALPSATNVFVIAQQYGVWKERASSAVAISTLISILTVTTLLFIVNAGYLS